MGRFLAFLATLLILLLGAAFIAPAFMDWNVYRPDIEEAASAVLGRKLHIAGEIKISLLPEVHFHANKVTAENGNDEGAAITADAVDLSLSLQALLAGKLQANRLTVVRPVVAFDFSKPILRRNRPTNGGAFTAGAIINQIEIVNGRVSVFSKDYGGPDALSLNKINGTIFNGGPGAAYRFNGTVSYGKGQFDLRMQALPTPGAGLTVAGTALDSISKAVLQADGILDVVGGGPHFEGKVELQAPQAAAGLPFDMHLKGQARIALAGMSLSDLVLTLDEQNRPQLLNGSAEIGFAAQNANISLSALSFDTDAMSFRTGAKADAAATLKPADWNSLSASLESLLWSYPKFALRLALSSDHLQLNGELLDGIKIDASRAQQRWVFERVVASLPGESALRMAGTLTKSGTKSRLLASTAVEGRSLNRLARWILSSSDANLLPAKSFSIQGSLTLAEDVSALEGVTGTIDGSPFKASFHLDRLAPRRLQLSLAADSLDVGGGRLGKELATAASSTLGTALQDAFRQAGGNLGLDASTFDTADVDISAKTARTDFIEASNFAVRLRFDPEQVTVSKLNAETTEGLSLRGEGRMQLRGEGQSRFDARLEARTVGALFQAMTLAGYDADSLKGRYANDFAPAVIAVGYRADGEKGAASLEVSGNLGPVRIDGRAQLKSVADWRTAPFSAEINVDAPDGNRLLAQLVPGMPAAVGPSPSHGTFNASLTGTLPKLETSIAIRAEALQAQADGTAELKGKGIVFSGKASASSPTPELFLAGEALALLGGEPKAKLLIETELTVASGRLSADKLKAQSPGNVTTGHVTFDSTGGTRRIEADLRADRFSLPSIFTYFLSPAKPDQNAWIVSSVTSPAASDIWSERPFLLSSMRETSGTIVLAAKTMKLSEAFIVSDGQLTAKLEKARLNVQKLEGRALGGDFSGSLTLEAKANVVEANARFSLAAADLSELANAGTPPVATGRASLMLFASGQGLSPKGIISVLQGRGAIDVSDGQLTKISPSQVEKTADELLANPLPLTQAAIEKSVLEAAQSADFRFGRLKIPVTIHDGIFEVRRASFRNPEGSTVRMEAYVDLSKMQADSTWQMGVSSDRRTKWPPIKIQLSGPLRELGAQPRTLAAEDFVRAVLVRKMEGDITRLEGLNKTPPGHQSSWAASQEPSSAKPARRDRRNQDGKQIVPQAQNSPPSTPPSKAPANSNNQNFESRMRDALESRAPENNTNPR